MAVIGPAGVNVKVTTTSSTASFRDISQQLLTFSGFDIEAAVEESHTFGDSWREHLFSQFSQINEITFGAFYDDDTSTGLRGIFMAASDVGAERVAKINLGTTNAYVKFDFIHRRTAYKPTRGALSQIELTWAPTGTFTIVTT